MSDVCGSGVWTVVFVFCKEKKGSKNRMKSWAPDPTTVDLLSSCELWVCSQDWLRWIAAGVRRFSSDWKQATKWWSNACRSRTRTSAPLRRKNGSFRRSASWGAWGCNPGACEPSSQPSTCSWIPMEPIRRRWPSGSIWSSFAGRFAMWQNGPWLRGLIAPFLTFLSDLFTIDSGSRALKVNASKRDVISNISLSMMFKHTWSTRVVRQTN